MPHELQDSVTIVTAIEALEVDDVAAFVTRHIRERRLTRIVRTLNRDTLSSDVARRQRAENALHRIGFI
ncbi:MAG: hypothetical protein GC146_04415 [Limimaricola sp.]|uniref:hypothetical protein n=1 Tax=Limimaricola sp. TaxID=2211665 RepID=UPI001DF65B2E|nr:hypothetical protein [Limimaricola sp.]MBI1416447.1 hypothetical protein [Limimaricola sp.]